MLPTVTIVTPSFNQGKYLEQTINSVLTQQYPNLEYVVMDGGSTDNSVEIIKRYERYLTYWTSEPDNGQCDAINRGWNKGTGEILAWINSDDIYEPGVIQEAATYLIEHPECGMVCGTVLMFRDNDPDDVFWREKSVYVPLRKCFSEMRSPGTTAAFVRRSALENVGYLDTSLHYWIDPELWFRVALKWQIGHIERPWYRFRVHSASKTASRSKFAAEEIEIARKFVSMKTLPPSLHAAAKRGLLTTLLRAALLYAKTDLRQAIGKLREATSISTLASLQLIATRGDLQREFARSIFFRS